MAKSNLRLAENAYFDLEPGGIVLEGTPGKWDSNGVHTLSIMEADLDGWKYWGYYCGGKDYYSFGTGLARSHDLQSWTKYSTDAPIVGTDSYGYGGRWPSVMKIGPTFSMFVTKDYLTDSHIVLYTSTDGIHFDYVKEVVRSEAGLRNQNPNLFQDPITGKYHLYYYHGNDRDLYQIRSRSSASLTGLDMAEEKIILSDRNDEIVASPSMIFLEGNYYLLTETLMDGASRRQDWRTRAWVSREPEGGFTELKNSPLPDFIHACAFQHILNNTLVITYSYQLEATPEWKWDVRMTRAVRG